MTNQEIIKLINRYQRDEKVHSLTCGNNSNHGLLYPYETYEGNVHLVCPDCIWSQQVTNLLVETLKMLYETETKAVCPLKDPDDANTYNLDDVCPVCGATGHITDKNEELMNKYCPTD